MKRIFFLAVTFTLLFFGCSKKNDQPASSQTAQTAQIVQAGPNTLVANAGSDTTICMPYAGLGSYFKGRLDGSASLDDSGKIVAYSWSEILGNTLNSWHYPVGYSSPYSTIYSNDSAVVTFLLGGGGVHQFELRVRDDHGRVATSKVRINVTAIFDAEYDGLSWDSTAGVLKTISVKVKPGLIESWPGPFVSDPNQPNSVYLSNFNGNCNDISSWNQIPYVPYDSIQLTDKPVFYSLIFGLPNSVNMRIGYPEIYAKTNSGIDFNQKVSIGFTESNPSGAGDWDY